MSLHGSVCLTTCLYNVNSMKFSAKILCKLNSSVCITVYNSPCEFIQVSNDKRCSQEYWRTVCCDTTTVGLITLHYSVKCTDCEP